MSQALPGLRIGRAKLANARPGDRDRLARALALASPAATGVAERGLLLVGKIRVDRPLGAGVESFAGAVVDRIRAAKASARRGSLGAGESVYFENANALEVAIVGAWLGGERLPGTVQGAIDASETPLLRWRRTIFPDGRKLSGAVAALAEAGTAGRWLAHFDEGELLAAAELGLRTYGGSPARVKEAGEFPPPTNGKAPPERSAASHPSAIVQAVAQARTLAPSGAARMLLAVAILAARRPALVATQAFQAVLGELREGIATARNTHAAVQRAPRPVVLPAKEPDPAAFRIAGPLTNASATPGREDAAAAPRPRRAAAARTTRAEPARRSAAPPAAELPPLVEPASLGTVSSHHAGSFFLLNVFLALGLYGDFTDPAQRLKGLSPFELVLLLGRRWLGPRFAQDPIEPVLRSLSGLLPREPVGRGFDAPTWQAHPEWLAPWPDLPVRTIAARFGTSRWHRSGFPLADCWESPRPPAWMRRRWVACLARYIEARLARALGIGNGAEAVRMLVCLRGTIRVDPEHVEIAFALDAHPLAVRLAGLDRDPGWIPSAGRSIGFRFT